MAEITSCSDGVPGTWGSAGTPSGRTIGSVPFYLFRLDINTPVYYTDADRTIVWNANTYSTVPFKVEDVVNDSGPAPKNVRIGVSNVVRSLSATIMAEQIQGREATVWKSYWTASQMDVHTTPYVYFRGLVDAVFIKEDIETAHIGIEIKNDFTRWDRGIPSTQFSGGCNWTFKSGTPGCQYTGAASLCDRSYARCTALNNTDRFRGFRQLIQLEDREMWWGKKNQNLDD